MNVDESQKSTADLVKEAVAEAKELVRIEVELAKVEARGEVRALGGAAAVFGVGAAAMIVCLALLGVAIVLAIGGTAVAALIVAACFFLLAAMCAGIGYALVPKKPMEQTRERALIDVHRIRERVA